MLFLSRIHPIKGLPMLLAALARHRDQLHDWRLLIAGPDEAGHRAEVERLALQLGVTDMILFPGALYEADKRDAFAAADLFVLPTHTENFGIVIAEALASQRAGHYDPRSAMARARGASLRMVGGAGQRVDWRRFDRRRVASARRPARNGYSRPGPRCLPIRLAAGR